MKRLKTQMGLGEGEAGDEAMTLLADSTAKITSAVTSLPELLERKKLIDTHTTIATELLDIIKNRSLDNFFEIEEKIMAKGNIFEDFAEALAKNGTAEDKIRLYLLATLTGTPMTSTQSETFTETLVQSGVDMNSLRYIERWKTLNNLTSVRGQQQYGGGGTKTVEMFSKLMAQSSQFVMEGVKNLVVKRHNLPLTKLVDALMERKSTPETDEFKYFDPKLLRSGGMQASQQSKTAFQDAIVFVIGGGCCMEYQNLTDYCKSKASSSNPKHVMYGCTELMNASKFLSYLNALGASIN